MQAHPLRFASLAIAGFLAVTGFDIATGLEHWPFGSYPMYSTLYPAQLSWLWLYGVTDRGEVPLRGEVDLAPFDQARLIMALQRLQGAPAANQKLNAALRNLMRLSARRKDLRALRLYKVSWALRPGLEGSEPPSQRVLIVQVSADQAGAGQ
jgi:hypothetical protein